MRLITGVLTLVLTSSAGFAQAAPAQGMAPKKAGARGDRAAIEKMLIANELKGNDAVIAGDLAAFKTVAADDVLSISEMGIITMTDVERLMKPGVWKVTDLKRENFRVHWINANTAAVVYAWSAKGTVMNTPLKPHVMSTVFTKRGDQWLAVFHQEIPQAPPMVGSKTQQP